MILRVLAGLGLAMSLAGCASLGPVPVDIRAKLLPAANVGDPDHPDGENVVLTHFSHVGQLTTDAGGTIYVVDRRAVIAGMLAPRGKNAILFFDSRHRTSANSSTCTVDRFGARVRGCFSPATSTAFSTRSTAT